MDLKTFAAEVKSAAAKAGQIITPLEEVAGVVGFMIPGSAGASIREALAILKFIQANEGKIGADLDQIATDLEGAYAEFKASGIIPAPAPMAAAPAAPAAAGKPGSKPE